MTAIMAIAGFGLGSMLLAAAGPAPVSGRSRRVALGALGLGLVVADAVLTPWIPGVGPFLNSLQTLLGPTSLVIAAFATVTLWILLIQSGGWERVAGIVMALGVVVPIAGIAFGVGLFLPAFVLVPIGVAILGLPALVGRSAPTG
jgi:hypothetical protein